MMESGAGVLAALTFPAQSPLENDMNIHRALASYFWTSLT
jgi:hypothetical protein